MAWFKLKPTVKNDEEQQKLMGSKTKVVQEIEAFFPQTLDEAELFAKVLLLQKPIMLNFSKTSFEQRRRILDFTCGIAFVLNININKISSDLYHLTFNRK